MILEVSYEQLLTKPDIVIQEIYHHCGLEKNNSFDADKFVSLKSHLVQDKGYSFLGPHAAIGRWERFASFLEADILDDLKDRSA